MLTGIVFSGTVAAFVHSKSNRSQAKDSFAAKPKLLLLDEITANLDVQTEECVMQAMKRASADRTVISISHRINAQTGRIINLSKNEEMF